MKAAGMLVALLGCTAGLASAGRVRNDTLRMPPTPGAPATYSYQTTNAFPGLLFTNPIVLATPPGENDRIFVVERPGRIIVVTNLAAGPARAPAPFLNISSRVNAGGEGGLLGLAFHPQYSSNGYFYVYYTAAGTGFSNRVSRFQVSATNVNVADGTSELGLIGQYDEASNHNGGDLHFGADGYLYVGLGDEGAANDTQNNSQTITKDFFSAILRLDVDKKPGSLPPTPHPSIIAPTNYAVPPDNPFVGATNFNHAAVDPAKVRTEFYAVGIRNAWRFSFDAPSGRLYCGDVGQNAWEEVDVITNGGNYGWAYREAFVAGPKSTAIPTNEFAQPILAYAHGTATNQGNSITGGLVYRGDAYPELYGRYIFADYVSGNIWSLLYDGTAASQFMRIAADAAIVSFGTDPRNGDILLCDLTENLVKRLVRASGASNALPATLAATGAFADTATLTPNPGVVPYGVNVAFWSDNAVKQRWFSVPDTNLTITFNRDLPWEFPTGTVWVKHFDLPLIAGETGPVRRLETRLLVKNASSSGGYGVTYRWGASMTNAALVPEEGLDEPIMVQDGGTLHTQVWHYPSRSECLICHPPAGFALGFDTVQVNRESPGGALTGNQVRAMSESGYFSAPVTDINTLRALVSATNESASLESRVRSYLHANCRACHLPGGTAPGMFDSRLSTALSAAGIVNGLLNNTLGDAANRVVAPGDVGHSMLVQRIAMRGPGQMPPLATSVVDTQSVALLTAWINGPLASYQTFEQWQSVHFGGPSDTNAAAEADPDRDHASNYMEYLLSTDPTNELSAWKLDLDMAGLYPTVIFTQAANRGYVAEWSSNLLDAGGWRALDVPGNEPFISAAPRSAAIADVETNAVLRYYRGKAFEP